MAQERSQERSQVQCFVTSWNLLDIRVLIAYKLRDSRRRRLRHGKHAAKHTAKHVLQSRSHPEVNRGKQSAMPASPAVKSLNSIPFVRRSMPGQCQVNPRLIPGQSQESCLLGLAEGTAFVHVVSRNSPRNFPGHCPGNGPRRSVLLISGSFWVSQRSIVGQIASTRHRRVVAVPAWSAVKSLSDSDSGVAQRTHG